MKKMTRRRITALFMAVLMVVGILPLSMLTGIFSSKAQAKTVTASIDLSKDLDIALDMDAKHAQSHTQFAAFKRMFFVGVIMAAALVLPQYVHPIGVVFGIMGLKITALMYPKLHPVIQKYRKKRL